MVKRKIEWSIAAKLDLFDILAFYIERTGSVSYSKKLNSKINKNINLLVRNPNLVTQTDYDSVRVLITGDYQIVYEKFDQLILIIMVWDCRRNPEDKRIKYRL